MILWKLDILVKKQSEFMPYAENKDQPTETVYGWVPTEVIQKVIESHGGINTLKNKLCQD